MTRRKFQQMLDQPRMFLFSDSILVGVRNNFNFIFLEILYRSYAKILLLFFLKKSAEKRINEKKQKT